MGIKRRLTAAFGAMAFIVGAGGCASGPSNNLASFIRGTWECAIEEMVADVALYPRLTIGESEIRIETTVHPDDMDGDGVATPYEDEPVTLPYRVEGAAIILTPEGEEELTVSIDEAFPGDGDIAVTVNEMEGYSLVIDGDRADLLFTHEETGDTAVALGCERDD